MSKPMWTRVAALLGHLERAEHVFGGHRAQALAHPSGGKAAAPGKPSTTGKSP